jgi:mannose-6-phosphate isomerase-like protein (cupin superfamily)
MEGFDSSKLVADLAGAGEEWVEFLRVPAMSLGIYRLAAGQEDLQTPHHEDEVYVVLQGRAVLRAGDREVPALPGSVLFVEAEAEHRFERIEEDFAALVVFAPAETG